MSRLDQLNKAFGTPSPPVERAGVRRSYEGADRGRRTHSFPLNNLSANKDIGADATLLRQRARYLYQNTQFAKRAINAISNGVVGTGISPKITSSNKRAQETIIALWKAFAEETKCDFYGRLDFYGIEKLITKTYKRDGECLILRRRVPLSESPIGMQMQVLEMEYVADYINFIINPGGGWTMNGIEYDKRGKVLYYWLFKRHPSEYWTQPEKYAAEDIIHILDVDFPGQNRGVPAAAPTIIEERDLDEYEDSELMAKKIQASFAMARVTLDPEKMEAAPDPDDYDKNEDLEKIEPGAIYHLFPGEQLQPMTPPTAPGAEDYRKSKHRNIATGYEVTYEMLSGDYSQVNFSSGRMGWIEHQRSLDHWQWMTLIPTFCKRAFGWFLEQVPLAPGSQITIIPKDLTVSWSVPKREMLDPTKETNALKNQIRTGLISLQEGIRQRGDDPDEVLRQMKEDLAKFQKAGISAEWSPNLDAMIATPAKENGQASRSVEMYDMMQEILDYVSSK